MEPAINDFLTEHDEFSSQEADNAMAGLSQHTGLVLPRNRRMVLQYLTDETSSPALHLYYDDKEIFFDEPDLFPFGEALARQTRFTASDATGWGEGYEWPRIRDLLQKLIDEGVLIHAANFNQEAVPPSDAIVPSPLPASTCRVPRSWDECEAITRELAGRPVELGYLELIIPVFRVAHVALDADQRQLGEANVFPEALRLDVPTEWRTCNLPGSRYQSELPMNVTAMRVMRAHWPQMMAAALRVREEYLRRFPEADGAWTVGHVERLSVAVLALPTYQLMRQHNRVENGALHPALSSLFRVTDGVRMVMHLMLLFPANEPTRPPHQALTADEILDYAERNSAFHSDYGVCAGPRIMVRELINVLLEGQGNADYASVPLEPAVQAALDDLGSAVDYGFHGLRAFATVFSLWPVMARAYEQLTKVVKSCPSIDTPVMVSVRDFLGAQSEPLMGTFLAHETWRSSRENVYFEMYRQCGRGLPGLGSAPGLNALLVPGWTGDHRRTEAELQEILRHSFELENGRQDAFVQDFSATLMEFLSRTQSVLRTATAVQDDINQLLGRAQPKLAFSAADINVHNDMHGPGLKPLPYLIHEMERLLSVRINLDADRLTIARRDAVA